jgi:hypothetical protein
MSYIEAYRKKNQDIPPAVTDKTDKTPSQAGFVSFVSASQGNIGDFFSRAPWPPRPRELAGWPVRWRQRWGELANRFEEVDGIPFPESERRAFDQVKAQMEVP